MNNTDSWNETASTWGPSSELRVRAASGTHVGRRSNNEDSILVAPEHGVFVVADGMGGYEGGEVASQLAVETVERFFRRNADDEEVTWPWGFEPGRSFVANLLVVALRLANREIMVRRKGKLEKMGATVAAAALDGDRVVLAHAGDSRIYRLRGGELEQLTTDHSLVEQMRAMGTLEIPEGMGHIVTKVLGHDADVRPDLRVEPVLPGDTLLLCSDGLTDPLEDAEIRRYLGWEDLERGCDALIRAAYDAGGADNITALLIRFGP